MGFWNHDVRESNAKLEKQFKRSKGKSSTPEQACPVVVKPLVDRERSEAINDNDTQSAARIDRSLPETHKSSGEACMWDGTVKCDGKRCRCIHLPIGR